MFRKTEQLICSFTFSECLCARNALFPLVHEPLTGTQSLQAALETPGKSGTERHLGMWEASGEEERQGLPCWEFPVCQALG